MTPWASRRCRATWQLTNLGWPSGLAQRKAAHTARAISTRVACRGSSVIWRMVSISAAVKDRPL